jgi:putative membrane-bound dehydrogenase-like protein
MSLVPQILKSHAVSSLFGALPRALFALPLLLLPALRAEFPTPTNNQPETIPLTPPGKTIELMHLPPGFKATVFAHEPDVQQPIAMCWDERGRLWVAENYTYSDAKERFDLKLRDRILIFEDSKNAGHFDKRTVFADDLQMLTSIERGFGGVYALCPPNLLWIPAKGDQPSGPPQVVLDGFSTTASSRHTFANGLKWGPDGWLYGRVGITSTSMIDVPGTPEEKRKPTAGGIWRYHPTRKIYEPYCHGTTNPWGMDWDEHGEMFFINTVIGHLWHGIQGAHFKRMHGDDPYPHIYGLIDQHADHYHWDTGEAWSDTKKAGPSASTSEKGGGHAHVGMMIYQGTNWPKEYRGKIFTTNLHGHRVNVDRLEREGSGYVGKHEPDFMKTDDPWFRATEIQYGPDGGVYILDWSDIGECHEADGVHRTSGRIYKITYGDPLKPKETDLTKLSDGELVKLQLSDNEWLVRMARWELRERAFRGESPINALKQLVALEKTATGVARRNVRTAFFSEREAAQGNDRELLPEELPPPLPLEEDDIVQMLKQQMFARGMNALHSTDKEDAYVEKADPGTVAKVKQVIEGWTGPNSTPRVRLTFSSALHELPTKSCLHAAGLLLSHAEDATDHNLPLMYWFGIRDLPPADLVTLVKDCRIPLVTQFIARRVTEEIEKDPAPLNALFNIAVESKTEGLPADVLHGMTDALKGWRKAGKPATWDRFAASVASAGDPALLKTIRGLNVLFGDGRALDEVRAIAQDQAADVEARRSALRTLVEAKSPDTRKICEKLLTEQSLSLDAVQGLAIFDDPSIAEMIVKRWRSFYSNQRNAVVAVLASRPSFAKVLLGHIGGGVIQRTDITPAVARQIRSFSDGALTKKLNEVWGEQHESSDDKIRLIAALRAKLAPEVIAKADQSRGRLVFSQVCAVCHKLYGEGQDIGPDLTGSGRHDLNYLLENIVDPSAIVAADFKMSIFTLRDGRMLNGIIHGQNERTLTVKMIGQEVTVEKSEIAKQEQLAISMMPEGLLVALGDEQTRNLIAYLMGNGQVALPQPAAK